LADTEVTQNSCSSSNRSRTSSSGSSNCRRRCRQWAAFVQLAAVTWSGCLLHVHNVSRLSVAMLACTVMQGGESGLIPSVFLSAAWHGHKQACQQSTAQSIQLLLSPTEQSTPRSCAAALRVAQALLRGAGPHEPLLRPPLPSH
jgi:hypothetical protein